MQKDKTIIQIGQLTSLLWPKPLCMQNGGHLEASFLDFQMATKVQEIISVAFITYKRTPRLYNVLEFIIFLGPPPTCWFRSAAILKNGLLFVWLFPEKYFEKVSLKLYSRKSLFTYSLLMVYRWPNWIGYFTQKHNMCVF